MELTYDINPLNGRKTAPDGTDLTEGMADAVDRLAYLQGWATNVQPPDLGGRVHIYAYTTECAIDEHQLRDLVQVCKIYGINYHLSSGDKWTIKLDITPTVRISMDAAKEQPVVQSAEDLLFA